MLGSIKIKVVNICQNRVSRESEEDGSAKKKKKSKEKKKKDKSGKKNRSVFAAVTLLLSINKMMSVELNHLSRTDKGKCLSWLLV